MIREFGYGSLNTRDKLVAKKGLVFAYWKGLVKSKSRRHSWNRSKPGNFPIS